MKFPCTSKGEFSFSQNQNLKETSEEVAKFQFHYDYIGQKFTNVEPNEN